MILSLNAQALLFLMTVLAGGAIGLLYDCIRIFRKMIPHKNFLIQVEDALYWICVVFCMFLIMLHKNHGEIRFFSVCGAFLGMALYYFALSPIVDAVSDRVVAAIKYVVSLFFTILFTPFRLLYFVFRKPVTKVRFFFRAKRKKWLHLCKVCVKIKIQKLRRNAGILLHKK